MIPEDPVIFDDTIFGGRLLSDTFVIPSQDVCPDSVEDQDV